MAAVSALPKPDHVLIVMLENKRYDAVIGDAAVPWINSLAAGGRRPDLQDVYGLRPTGFAAHAAAVHGLWTIR